MKKINTFKVFRILLFAFIAIFLPLSLYAQIEEGYYTIRLANVSTSGWFVDITTGEAHANSDLVTLKTSNISTSSQVWKIERDGSNYYIKQPNSGKSIDASYWRRNENGCPILMWDFNRGETQRWLLEPIESNQYRIKLALNNKIVSFDIGTGLNLYLTDVVNNSKQIFIIEKSTRVIKSTNFVDLRANQTPYANQGPRGTCTYFASIAALEAAYKRAGYGTVNLSEHFFSIFAKSLGLHAKWSDITTANYRENQYATTQGGGSVEYLKYLKVPEESVSPYQSVEDLEGYSWANLNQRTCNDFNLNLIRRDLPVLHNVEKYYSVLTSSKIATITETSLETVLRLGYEIKICIYGGSHCVLLVGFDKSDPTNKRFIMKNSYTETGTPCTDKLEYLSYSEIPRMVAAEYITSVRAPGKWKELAAIGRWKLDFDGWKGQLDIYHIPGVAQFDLDNQNLNGERVIDRRLGTYYDNSGTAFRVNGSIQIINASSIKLTFYINGNKPNLRWDELSGRKFEYIISAPDGSFMAGKHTDGDGRQYGGYGLKYASSFLSSDAFTMTGNVTPFFNQSFFIKVANEEYFGRFNVYNPTLGYTRGTFTSRDGVSRSITLTNSINALDVSIAEIGATGKVRTHSWQHGISSGDVLTSGNVYMPVCIIRRNANPLTTSTARTSSDPENLAIDALEGPIDPVEDRFTKQLPYVALNVYPNPTTGKVYLPDFQETDEPQHVTLMRIDGHVTLSATKGEASVERVLSDALEAAPIGIYQIIIRTEGKVHTGRIVKN